MITLKESSLVKLKDVHEDLVKVVMRAAEITDITFVVATGSRSLEEQKKKKAAGLSKTLRSRHIKENNQCGLSCAVDLGVIRNGVYIGNGEDPDYKKLYEIVKQAADEVGVTIEWGGFWKSPFDPGHYQLPWNLYP